MNISEWRVKYLLEYKGNTTLNDYLVKNTNLDAPRIYSLCLQLIYIVMLLDKGGYSHNALHALNIMVNETKVKHFVFNGKNVKFYGIHLSVIDYGDVMAKKFKLKYNDYRQYAFTDEWLTRVLHGCLDLILPNFAYKIKYCIKLKAPLPWDKKENMTRGLKRVFKNNKKFCGERLKKYLKIYPKGKSAIAKFLTILTTNKKISDVIPRGDMYYFNIIVNRIVIEFDILHPALFKDYYGWALETKWLLPKEECLELFTMTDSKSIVKWFLNKV